MEQNYYFIDGSSLIAQIRTLWKKDPKYNWRRLDPLKFIGQIVYSLPELGSANYKRAEFYFPKGEQNIDTYLLMPKNSTPGLVRDVHFKYCGEKLDRSSAYETWLDTVPPQWLDRCTKSEKGVDIEICCDALRLASFGKMDRLFLFTNDRDFVPLCKTLKDFGVNISLIHLSNFTNPNKLLLDECDSYDLLKQGQLELFFETNKAKNTEDADIPGMNNSPHGDIATTLVA
ncbi:MAG: NYN domain-containing protein [Patescibacteria group bacterium]